MRCAMGDAHEHIQVLPFGTLLLEVTEVNLVLTVNLVVKW